MKSDQTWGRWKYHRANQALTFIEDGTGFEIYEIDLEDKCNDSAEILDWIVQVTQKTWTTPEDIGNLVLAFNDLSGGLQSTVCGEGRNKRFDLGAYLRQGD